MHFHVYDGGSQPFRRSPPVGEQSAVEDAEMPPGVGIDSFTGPARVEWDREESLTPLGQLSFFIDFLQKAGLFEALRTVRCVTRAERPRRATVSADDAVDIVRTQALCAYRGAATALCLSFWA